MISAKFLHAVLADGTVCDQQLTLVMQKSAITQLHSILQRALNCADPKLYPDWVELCDKLDSLKRDGKI